MLKRLVILALWVTAIGVASSAQTQPNSTPEQGITKQSSRANAEPSISPDQKKDSSNNITLVIGNQENSPSHQSEASSQTEDIRIQGKLASLTTWLVGAGFLQAGILGLTIWAIIGQTKANKNSARAWILVKDVAGPPESFVDVNRPEHVPGIGIQFRVWGTTPAKVIDYSFCLDYMKRHSGSKTPDLPETPNYNRSAEKDIALLGTMRPPQDEFNLLLNLPHSPTVGEFLELANLELFVCAYGRIQYQDVFGRKAETRFCYIYDFARGGIVTNVDGKRLNPPGFKIGGPPAYNKAT